MVWYTLLAKREQTTREINHEQKLGRGGPFWRAERRVYYVVDKDGRIIFVDMVWYIWYNMSLKARRLK